MDWCKIAESVLTGEARDEFASEMAELKARHSEAVRKAEFEYTDATNRAKAGLATASRKLALAAIKKVVDEEVREDAEAASRD